MTKARFEPEGEYAGQVAEFHRLFNEAVAEHATYETPLFFSAGTDSTVVLAAMMELGYHPTCYHLCVEGWPSDDLERAKAMAGAWRLDLQVVTVPRARLIDDVRGLIARLAELPNFNPARTTVVQCCHVTSYLTRVALADGYDKALMGVGGVTDDTRKSAVAYYEGGDAAADPIRAYTLLMGSVPIEREVNPINGEIWYAGQLGLEVGRPYENPAFSTWLLGQPWRVVNHPRLKGIGLRAYAWFWRGHEEWYRPNTNMHVGSGMRELHADLVASDLNTRGVAKAVGVYHDLTRAARA